MKSNPIADSLTEVYPWIIHHEKATHVLGADKLKLMLLPAEIPVRIWGCDIRLQENGHILAVDCFEL